MDDDLLRVGETLSDMHNRRNLNPEGIRRLKDIIVDVLTELTNMDRLEQLISLLHIKDKYPQLSVNINYSVSTGEPSIIVNRPRARSRSRGSARRLNY